MSEWVSIEDAAGLEHMEYNTLVIRIGRGHYKTRTEVCSSGGRDRVFVAVESLSPEAQARYKYRSDWAKRAARAERCEEPWYIGVRPDRYIMEYEKEFYEKTALRIEIERYKRELEDIPRGAGVEFSVSWAERMGIGYKQLRRYIKRYDEACLFAERDGAEHYKTLALCRPPRKGQGAKLTEEMKALLRQLWCKPIYHQNMQPFIALYEEFCYRWSEMAEDIESPSPVAERKQQAPLRTPDCLGTEAELEQGTPFRIPDCLGYGAEPAALPQNHAPRGTLLPQGGENAAPGKAKDKAVYMPSYQTCKRYINSIEYGRSDVKALLADGYQGFRNTAMIKAVRDIKSLRVMELVMGDAHTFDCWVSVNKDGGTYAVRPYLVAFVDARSKVIVGWGICTCPNSEVIKNVLINMMYAKKDGFAEGVPRIVYIDNGKDFTSQELTGRKRTERFDIDRDIKGFYKSVGIEYDKRALPYTPWTKSQIERFFGSLCSRFSKRFESYTGTLTGSKTAAKRDKDIEKMLKAGELPDIEEFAAEFSTYLQEYHEREHSTLKADGEPVPTPRGVWENAERYDKPAPPIEYALSLLGKSAERRVYNIGIRLEGRIYAHELLGGYIGESVIVRYSAGTDGISVYRRDNGMRICVAYPAEEINPIAEPEDERLMEHLKAQKRQLRRVRDDIRRMSEPFAERALELPELSGEAPKVVSMPEDRQYREQAANTSAKKKKEESAFLKELAEEAYRNIG